MTWRYLLVEDEPPAAELLHTLIRRLRPEARCVGDARDGIQGLELLARVPSEGLFLDIEFPPEGAFGLLNRAREAGLTLPPLVFVTAYDHYAVEAFRWAARDYLLKPVEPGDLAEALGRMQGPQDLQHLFHALESARAHKLPDRFAVRVKGRHKLLRWEDVSHLQTDNRLLFVHTPEGRFILDRTLEELEPLLEGAFLRIHRGALVALSAISEFEAEPGAPGEVILRDGTRLPVSRERLARVRQRLVI